MIPALLAFGLFTSAGAAEITVLPPLSMGVDAETVDGFQRVVHQSLVDEGFVVEALASADASPCFTLDCAKAASASEAVLVSLEDGLLRTHVTARLIDVSTGAEVDRYRASAWSSAGLGRRAPDVAGSLIRRVDGRIMTRTVAVHLTMTAPANGDAYGGAPAITGSEVSASYESRLTAWEVRAGRRDADQWDTRQHGAFNVDERFAQVGVRRFRELERGHALWIGAGAGFSVWHVSEPGEHSPGEPLYSTSAPSGWAGAGITLGRTRHVQLEASLRFIAGATKINGGVPAGGHASLGVRFGGGQSWGGVPALHPGHIAARSE